MRALEINQNSHIVIVASLSHVSDVNRRSFTFLQAGVNGDPHSVPKYEEL